MAERREGVGRDAAPASARPGQPPDGGELRCAGLGVPKPKLLDQVRHVLRLQHLAYSTERQYVHWIRRFILFHQKRHPREMSKDEVTQFLTHLAVNEHVAASTQNQALCALKFLFDDVLQQELGLVQDVV